MSVSSEVQRTLVKSPPELWAELSDPATLARHLGELGHIRITGTVPERTVDWEAADGAGGEVSGRVEIEPSGWGTKVTLSASRLIAGSGPEPDPKPESIEVIPEVEPEPEPEPEIVEPEPRIGFWARLFRRRKEQPEPEPEPVAAVEIEEPAPEESAAQQPAPEKSAPQEPVSDEPAAEAPDTDISAELAELEQQTEAVLTGVLDRLGAAHHRPFSRA